MSDNDLVLKAISELRRDGQELRDAVMHRLGLLEGSHKTLADGLQAVRIMAERAEKTANEAKRKAHDSSAEIAETFTAVSRHLDDVLAPLRTNDRTQNMALEEIRKSVEKNKRADAAIRVYQASIPVITALVAAVAAYVLK